MATDTTDIVIAGGGIAGLSASCAFGAAGFRTLCVDPISPVIDRAEDGADLRTTAFLQPARSFLEEAGVWASLAPHATALRTMRIVDAGEAAGSGRVQKDFIASDIGETEFGYNLPNTQIRDTLLGRLTAISNVAFRSEVAVEALDPNSSGVTVTLSDGTSVEARLLVAADGRDSFVRQALKIGVQRYEFGQMALAFAVSHERPHHNVSTEVHRTGGPFTLVPLPDYERGPSSAVVWMETTARAQRLLQLDNAAFEALATERSAGVMGRLKLITPRSAWPIVSQIAHRFHGPRTALVAEAAHVMPPIGAQGLNTSLRDLQSLLDLARNMPQKIGEPVMLRRYHCSRYADVASRLIGISALNRVSMASPLPLQGIRATGLTLLHGVTPVRKALMRMGLGV
ncbi:MAG: UbiH/UbiF family hydroxylase [Pseudomonadota bacterium]